MKDLRDLKDLTIHDEGVRLLAREQDVLVVVERERERGSE